MRKSVRLIPAELIVVDMRPNIMLVIVTANQAILLFYQQTFIVIPCADVARRGVRRVFQTAAFAGLSCIAKAVADEMLAVKLRICRRLEVKLAVIDVIDIAQLVFPLVCRLACIVDQRHIVFLDARIVQLDVPVADFVHAAPTEIVRIAVGLALEMLLRLKVGIRALDVAKEILGVVIDAELEGVVLVGVVGADKSDRRRIAVVAQRRRQPILYLVPLCTLQFRKRSVLSMHARIHRHDLALAARKADTELAHVA